MEQLAAALIIGLMGSFHCIGMCGPIAMALPLGNVSTAHRLLGALVYNSGRVVTYALLGAIFGTLGKGFVIGGLQQWLSVIAGAAILIYLITSGLSGAESRVTKIMLPLINKIKHSLGLLINNKSYSSLFAIGLLNALLPCGLVYVAIAGSIATGNTAKGAMFMAAFGAGTVPAMWSLAIASGWISINIRNQMRRLVPVFVGAMAILLILRGLNLGIPYVSPELSKTDCTKHTCCSHKK